MNLLTNSQYYIHNSRLCAPGYPPGTQRHYHITLNLSLWCIKESRWRFTYFQLASQDNTIHGYSYSSLS